MLQDFGKRFLLLLMLFLKGRISHESATWSVVIFKKTSKWPLILPTKLRVILPFQEPCYHEHIKILSKQQALHIGFACFAKKNQIHSLGSTTKHTAIAVIFRDSFSKRYWEKKQPPMSLLFFSPSLKTENKRFILLSVFIKNAINACLIKIFNNFF